MKRVLSWLFVVALIASLAISVSASTANPFTDVKADRFEDAILWAYYSGITTGTGDGTTFSPENACTRKQIVTFLWRAAGEPEPQSMENPFVDVKADRFEKAILWAYYEGITTGTGDGTTFSPENTCTRKQIVTFLWRYNGEPAPESTEITFTDVKDDRFAPAILWAAEQNITTGTGDGSTFSPENPCTRKQIVTFLWRAAGEPAVPGTEANPITIIPEEIPYAYEVSVAAGETVYYCGYFNGMILDVYADSVSVNGVDAVDGSLSMELFSDSPRAPVNLAITNNGDEDAVYALQLSYPMGTQMNPETLFNVATVNVNIAENNDQGYYYSWYSRGEGTLILTCPTVEGIEYDVILTNMRNYAMSWLSESEDGTVSMDVVPGDEVIIQVVTVPDMTTWTYPALETVITGELVYPVGSQMNPETLFGIANLNVNIAEGNSQGYYYSWYSRGEGTLTLTCPTVEGVEYDVVLTNMSSYAMSWLSDSEDGTVSIDVVPNDQVVIQVVAYPDAEWNYPALETVISAELVYPIGSQMNPETLFGIANLNVNIAEGNSQGYYYSWYSRGEGTLTLTCPTVEGVEYDVVLTNMSSYAMSWLSDSEDGTVSIDVVPNDQVVIQVVAYPDAEWNYPALETVISAELVYPVGSQMNPEVITDASAIHVNVAEGNSQGYYYSWKALGDGTLTLTAPTVEGVEYDVVLTNMNSWAMSWLSDSEDGTVSIAVKGGDEVVIQIAAYPDAQWVYPALETVLTGEAAVVAPTDPANIVAAAYALSEGAKLPYEATLTGEIISIDTPYSTQFYNITVTIQVEGCEDYPIQCFRMAGEGCADLAVGDTITVTGTIKNYYGTVEFDAGCTLDAVVKGEVVVPEDPAQIVADAYALADSEVLPYAPTLTGEITSIKTAYNPSYGNISVVIAVEGCEDYPILCYRLKGEGCADLAVGDIITVTGTVKNYGGTIEFDAGCTLDAVVKGGNDTPVAPEDPAEIVMAAYELAEGESLPYNATLTGKILSVKEAYSTQYKNVSVVIALDGWGEYPILCYRMKGEGADTLAVGDKITVTGTLMNYKGTVEFGSGCTLDAVEKAWEADLNNHWHEGGTDLGEHTLGEDNYCTVCGVEVYSFFGETYVQFYDVNFHTTMCLTYGEDGELKSDERWNYAYDGTGKLQSSEYYRDGVLVYIEEYVVVANGAVCSVKYTEYMEDGSVFVAAATYDDEGNILTQHEYLDDKPTADFEYIVFENLGSQPAAFVYYLEDGSVSRTDYVYDSEGNSVSITESLDAQPVIVYEFALTADGYYSVVRITTYTEEGKVEVYETDFDVNGNNVYEKYYVDGILVQHSVYEYALDSWGWYYMCKETVYVEDGSYTVNEYNEYWELIASHKYDSDGNLIG